MVTNSLGQCGPDLLQFLWNLTDHYAQKMFGFSLPVFLLTSTTKANHCSTECRVRMHEPRATPRHIHALAQTTTHYTIWESCLWNCAYRLYFYEFDFLCSLPYLQPAMRRQKWTVTASMLFVDVPTAQTNNVGWVDSRCNALHLQ